MRKKSAEEALLPWARYYDKRSVSVPVAGSVIGGDRIAGDAAVDVEVARGAAGEAAR